jgi:Cytochrome P460
MREKHLKRLLFVLGMVVLATSLISPPTQRAIGQGFHFDATKLKDKTLWTQVNERPYYLSSRIDILCRMPIREDYESIRKENPHASSYITVYVNQIGRAEMFSTGRPRFPEGSVIVKEKRAGRAEMRSRRFDMLATNPQHPSEASVIVKEKKQEGSEDPILLYTLMIKREPGYNPAAGDWEYAVASGKDAQIEATGKLENCQACHLEKRDQDFVFRAYLKSK